MPIGVYFRTEKTRKNISIATKKAMENPIVREKISKAHKGIKRGELSDDIKRKIGKANKGKKRSEETKRKLSESHKGKMIGNKHPMWKGKNASYRALHSWVNRCLGKAEKCSLCGKVGIGRRIQWANIDHSYKRNLTDWFKVCCQCHGGYDVKKGLRKHNKVIL